MMPSALLILAFTMGLVANRTTLCAVMAVDEMRSKRKAKILASFGKVILWALAVSTLLRWLGDFVPIHSARYALNYHAILGGILLGIGAVCNGGCALHTLIRLGRGDLGMLISVLGMAASVWLITQTNIHILDYLQASKIPDIDIAPTYLKAMKTLLTLWIVVELFRLFRGFKLTQWKQHLFANRYRLSSAAAILGICNGVLFTIIGTWTYTYTLITSITELMTQHESPSLFSPLLLLSLSLTLLLGIAASAIQKRNFLIAFRPSKSWIGYLIGGTLMGLGAQLIPGGNDVLLFNSIPELSPHAIPAYISMLLGIAISLQIKQRFLK